MKRLKFVIFCVFLILFQESGLVYQGLTESAIEYSTENSESREEYVDQHITKSEVKSLPKKRPTLTATFLPPVQFVLKNPSLTSPVKRSILHRAILI